MLGGYGWGVTYLSIKRGGREKKRDTSKGDEAANHSVVRGRYLGVQLSGVQATGEQETFVVGIR